MEKILKTLGPTFLSLREFGFAFGIQGVHLRKNLEKYWFLQCITLSDYNVFYTSSDTLLSNVKDLSDMGLTNLPFGIAEINDVKSTWNQSFVPPKSKSFNHKIGKVTTFFESDDAIESVDNLFYTKSRERRSWWRMILENPSLVYMSEVKKNKGKEFVEIECRFPFGNILVETINYKRSVKTFLPHANKDVRILEQITSLDWGCLSLLCDGYEETEYGTELHMNEKLMPFKAYCIAEISPEDDEQTKMDLQDLRIYVINLLREKGVESVKMNNAVKPEIFKVPYIISVDSETLKTGILKMISQRTLCGEEIHITHLAERLRDTSI